MIHKQAASVLSLFAAIVLEMTALVSPARVGWPGYHEPRHAVAFFFPCRADLSVITTPEIPVHHLHLLTMAAATKMFALHALRNWN